MSEGRAWERRDCEAETVTEPYCDDNGVRLGLRLVGFRCHWCGAVTDADRWHLPFKHTPDCLGSTDLVDLQDSTDVERSP